MKQKKPFYNSSYIAILFIVLFLFSACDQLLASQSEGQEEEQEFSGEGVSTWIEYPLEGWIIPNQPVELVAYASGSAGVMGIQLSINGQSLPSLGVGDLSAEGTFQQVRLDYPWQPPAPGPYILSASAVGSSSGAGAGDVVNFCVETCEEQTPDTIPPTPTPDDAPTPTWTPETQDEDIPDTEPPPAPPEDTGGDGEEIPETEPLPEPPADTSAPSIDSGSIFFEGCQFYGQAIASDPSGIGWMKFGFNKNGDGWGWIWMSEYGGIWQSDAGISVDDGMGTPIGNIQYQFQAADTLGNETYSGTYSYSYTGCGG